MSFLAEIYISTYAILITFIRIWLIIIFSVIVGMFTGILSARVKSAELILVPIVDILESVPVIAFFPVILLFLLSYIGGGLGVELAVDFLLVTAVIWNLILGAYEGVSHIPRYLGDVSDVYGMTYWQRLKYLFVPAAYPKVVSNIAPSFASALFYVTFSEVISLGNSSYSVFGLGSVALQYASEENFSGLLILLFLLVIAIMLNYRYIIDPWMRSVEKFSYEVEGSLRESQKKTATARFVSSAVQKANIVASSGKRLVTSAVNTRTQHARRREPVLTSVETNLIVGIPLVVLIAGALYTLWIGGFDDAFYTYILSLNFLYSALIGLSRDLLRIVIVYAITLATMIPLSLYAGRKKKSGGITNMAFQVIYSIPAPVFAPFLLVFLVPVVGGVIGESLAINMVVLMITYLSAAAYIFFNVYGAVISLPSEMRMMASIFGFGKWMEFKYLWFPAMIPSLITGSMVAVGSYWGGLQVSEFLSVGGKTYVVSTGLMKMLDEAIALGPGGLVYAEALDLFLVFFILLISYLLWLRLYRFSKKRYVLE